MKKLMRSRSQRMFAGVLGGIGEYMKIDPTLVRLLFIGLTVFTVFFPGLLFYIIAMFVIPSE